MTAPLNKGAKGRREHLASLPKGGGSRRLTEGFIRQKYKSSLQTQIVICFYNSSSNTITFVTLVNCAGELSKTYPVEVIEIFCPSFNFDESIAV